MTASDLPYYLSYNYEPFGLNWEHSIFWSIYIVLPLHQQCGMMNTAMLLPFICPHTIIIIVYNKIIYRTVLKFEYMLFTCDLLSLFVKRTCW